MREMYGSKERIIVHSIVQYRSMIMLIYDVSNDVIDKKRKRLVIIHM